MGCCARTKEEVIIKSSIPLSYKKSIENDNSYQKNPAVIAGIVITERKKESSKTFDLTTEKDKNKTEKKNLKSMNILKEISYNEVRKCAKYFEKD